MQSIEKISTSLDQISRKFIRRKSPEGGYSSLQELCADIDSARLYLESVDSELDQIYTEVWLRLLNDMVSYCEDWPITPLIDGTERNRTAEALNAFQADIMNRYQTFTLTQRARVQSISLRARVAVQDSVLDDVIMKFGSTLEL